MRQHTLEIYVSRRSREAHCLISSPAYGASLDLPAQDLRQSLTLNDGTNRVKVGVYHDTLELAEITRLARMAVDAHGV